MKEEIKEQSTLIESAEKEEKKKYLRQCCNEYKAPTECCDHNLSKGVFWNT